VPVDAVAVYPPILGLNAMIAQHLGRWGPSVRGVSEVLRSATVARLASPADLLAAEPSGRPSVVSSSAPGTTEWRCGNLLLPYTNGGAANCTSTTAATRDPSSPGACRRRRSGSSAGSVRKAPTDCPGDLFGVADQQVDPCLALRLRHAHGRAADGDRAEDVACGIESPAVIA
jgi:hypothetical protein